MAAAAAGEVFVRRTEVEDAGLIAELIGGEAPIYQSRYGDYSVPALIERSPLSVTATDAADSVVGYAAFSDSPLFVPDVPQPADSDESDKVPEGRHWEQWLEDTYGKEEWKSFNIIWLNFLAAEHLNEHGILEQLLRTAFVTVPEAETCLFALPAGAPAFSPMSEWFVQAIPFPDAGGQYDLYWVERRALLAPLSVRRARVEDHDDLVPIFESQSDVLSERYGEFFLANIISNESESNKTLVAEVSDRAVGLLSISKDIDISVLVDNFQLEPYSNLYKSDEDDAMSAGLPSTRPGTTTTGSRPVTSLRPWEARGSRGAPGEGPIEEEKTEDHDEQDPESKVKEEVEADEVWDPNVVLSVVNEVEVGLGGGGGAGGEDAGEGEDGVGGESGAGGAGDGDGEAAGGAGEGDGSDKGGEGGDAGGAQRSDADGSQSGDEDDEGADEYDVINESLETNAFCITLFCLDELYETRGFEFLESAFDLFEDKDYCIITLPHTTNEFQLLRHFTMVPPKPNGIFSHCLYVFHRSALLGIMGELQLRLGAEEDIPAVNWLLRGFQDAGEVTAAFSDCMGDTPRQGFVATCGEQVIAVATFSTAVDIDGLRSAYRVEDFVALEHHGRDQHLELNHFVVNPIFARCTRFILKEIFRIFDKTNVFYKVVSGKWLPPFLLPELVAVRPRRLIEKPAAGKAADADDKPYALHFLTRKLIYEPKVNSNVRIVVVGASDTGLSLLETLIFLPYINFNNLVLLSPGGLPAPSDSAALFLPSSLCYNARGLAQMALDSRITIVDSKLVGIDRKHAEVILLEEFRLPYDYLVLSPGLAEASLEKIRGYHNAELNGVLSMSTAESAEALLEVLTESFGDHSAPIVVYGSSIESYVAIQGLFSSGVEGHRILHVHRPTARDFSCFNDPVVDDAVNEWLNDVGVQTFSGMSLVDLEFNHQQEIQAATFDDGMVKHRFECSLLVCCDKKDIEPDFLTAINEACLVCDGQLVLDSQFRTNDPTIYSAGPVSKFARRYGRMPQMRCFNSKEVGQTLARYLLGVVDPITDFDVEEASATLPKFSEPKVVCAVVPGGYQYFSVEPPVVPDSLAAKRARADYGRDIFTTANECYFRLHINAKGFVKSVTYLGKEPVEMHNLVCLYGLHVKYLNNLLTRFDEGQLTDLVAFFREPWAMALYHDGFAELRAALSMMIRSNAATAGALDEYGARKDGEASAEERKDLQNKVRAANKHALQVKLFKFLGENQNHLPMYFSSASEGVGAGAV